MLSLSLSSCHLTFVISFSHPHCHDHRGCHHKKSHKSSLSKSDSNVRKQTRVHLILSISISRPSLLDAFLTQPHLHRQSFSQNKERLHNKIQNSKDQNKQTPTINDQSSSSSLPYPCATSQPIISSPTLPSQPSLPKRDPLMQSNILDGSSDAHGCHHHHVRPREVLLSLYLQLS